MKAGVGGYLAVAQNHQVQALKSIRPPFPAAAAAHGSPGLAGSLLFRFPGGLRLPTLLWAPPAPARTREKSGFGHFLASILGKLCRKKKEKPKPPAPGSMITIYFSKQTLRKQLGTWMLPNSDVQWEILSNSPLRGSSQAMSVTIEVQKAKPSPVAHSLFLLP
ncbi:uncharacterized protein Gm26637 isoform X2 [Mus musculus]|uniref:uncharacterized protein Gm26637 isoform X2 n=1 Tax=Mus musculus TaxID=10090 RepID=UPI0005ABA654|nr:uncharacterized protein Gm26637 isoform X2 [Mus musculus]|eukprot:XP_011245080.1 PREDICTED: uncharacterized protein Gm26637 isoform X2 [Mus musculus]